MKTVIPDNLIHIVILDISGVYAQIHNDGYFEPVEAEQLKQTYKDTSKYRVIEV